MENPERRHAERREETFVVFKPADFITADVKVSERDQFGQNKYLPRLKPLATDTFGSYIVAAACAYQSHSRF